MHFAASHLADHFSTKMLSLTSVLSRSERAIAVNVSRCMSTKAPMSQEEINTRLARLEKLKVFNQHSVNREMMLGAPSGRDVHIPENVSEIAALTGMPAEHQKRRVYIAPVPFKTSQSGYASAHLWTITWGNRERWLNPLMGWGSSADPMAQVKLTFDNKEDAINYATRNGWKFQVAQETSMSVRPVAFNTYKDNFLDKRTQLALKKDGNKTKIYATPGYGKSNFFMPLKFHGNGPVDQHGPSKK